MDKEVRILPRYGNPHRSIAGWNAWFTRFGPAVAVLIMLALVAPPALCGQDQGYSTRWRSDPSSGQLAFDEPTNPDSSMVLDAPEAVVSQLTPMMADAADAPRNRALEIVRRSDDYAVRRYKKGFFQRMRLSGTWIGGGGDEELGISNLDAAITVAVPLGSFENLLLVTPGFEVDFLDGPTELDLPSQLYATGVDLMWRKQFNDRWGSMIAVRPAVASDFQTTQDAFRLTGRALATWQWVPERLSLLFGVVYLDRNDIPILPGAGLIWTPTPDWRLDLIFPRPKLARRLAFIPRLREDWVYLGGSLGGRTWAVERQPGVPDQLTLRDYRLFAGWERIVEGGGGMFAEAGFVFGRELEFEDVPLSHSFDDAFMIRGGFRF